MSTVLFLSKGKRGGEDEGEEVHVLKTIRLDFPLGSMIDDWLVDPLFLSICTAIILFKISRDTVFFPVYFRVEIFEE